MSVVIVSSYDEKLNQMVSREVYLSDNATCEHCGKDANKKYFPYYHYDFEKKKYRKNQLWQYLTTSKCKKNSTKTSCSYPSLSREAQQFHK